MRTSLLLALAAVTGVSVSGLKDGIYKSDATSTGTSTCAKSYIVISKSGLKYTQTLEFGNNSYKCMNIVVYDLKDL